ncbi:hypothetical protein WR25_08030 [Diploscapter pachys]|uniref:Replication termination factor 2 n=1 Tax=Diploscapter pachys TaxID=2018661 RepID=A0A2A2JE04_9BILA|nr:hypothetical protein WR25_08030 [Diploscapter pachys]
MGADGGTIPKRCELVKAKKKKEKLDKNVKNANRWKNCQMTQEPLKKPIIACRYGRLYNKEAVIEAILTKTIGKFENMKHIKGIKDFKDLKLTENKDYKGGEAKGDEYTDYNQTQFICSVTGVPMNGNQKFVANWKCGCVFSEKALNEVKSDVCRVCSGPIESDSTIQLYPDDDLLEMYKERLAAQKAEKKSKKENKEEAKNGDAAAENEVKIGTSAIVKKEVPESSKLESKLKLNGIKTESGERKRKAAAEPTTSIQSDPTKSSTYKKLFTSCEEAKAKPQGHWVTHNPLYY